MSRYAFLLSISFRKLQDRSHNSNPTALRSSSHYTVLLGFIHLSEKFERHNRRQPATQSWKTLGLPLQPSGGCSGRASFHFTSHCPPIPATMQAIRHTGPGNGFVPSLYNSLKHSGSQHAELSVTQFWNPPGPTPVTEMVQSRQAPAFVWYCCRSEALQAIRCPHPLPTTYDQFRTCDATHTPWAGISLVLLYSFRKICSGSFADIPTRWHKTLLAHCSR
jgi:hypothetical protein